MELLEFKVQFLVPDVYPNVYTTNTLVMNSVYVFLIDDPIIDDQISDYRNTDVICGQIHLLTILVSTAVHSQSHLIGLTIVVFISISGS